MLVPLTTADPLVGPVTTETEAIPPGTESLLVTAIVVDAVPVAPPVIVTASLTAVGAAATVTDQVAEAVCPDVSVTV